MKASIISLVAAVAAVQAGVVASSNDTMVTSTILTTQLYTVTSCAPTVTNCPVGAVTSTVRTTTTVCPITAVYPPAPPPTTTPVYAPSTSTILSTVVYTISSCAPTVTNCPYGSKTHSVLTSTVVYGTSTSTPPPAPTTTAVVSSKNSGSVSSVAPVPYCPTAITSYITVTALPSKSVPAVAVSSAPATVVYTTPAAPYGTAAPTGGKTYNTTTSVPFTGAASAQKAGGLLMAVGIAVAALL